MCIEDLGYRVDSFIFDRTFEDNSDITHRGLFMMRYIQKERVKIFELVSVFTGNVIYYNFENIEKRQLQEELNIYGCGDELGIISTDSSSVCYTDFDACYFDLKSGVGSTAASDWVSWFLPGFATSTINMLACANLQQSGHMENTDHFIGCGNCSILIGGVWLWIKKN